MKMLIAFIALAQLFSSCFGTKPIKQTHKGELTNTDKRLSDIDSENDDSFYDEYPFEVAEGMVVKASLKSDAFDAYLHSINPDGRRVASHDDTSEDDTNATIKCLAPADGEFKVLANSYGEDELGAYTLDIETAKATEGDASLEVCKEEGTASAGGAAAPEAPAPAEAPAPSGIQVVP